MTLALAGSWALGGCTPQDSRAAATPAAAADPAPAPREPSPGAAALDDEPDVPPPPPARLPRADAHPLPEFAGQGKCPRSSVPGIGLAASPERVTVDRPLRIWAATQLAGEPLSVRVIDAKGRALPLQGHSRRGNPVATVARATPRDSGRLEIQVARGEQIVACARVVAVTGIPRNKPPAADLAQVWPVRRAWTAAEEALYSAWIRELFWAEPGAELATRNLQALTSDEARNLLHDHFGWGEDGRDGLKLVPDCADTPYFLRAYWSVKRGLPFGFRRCSRGADGKPPKCSTLRTNLDPPDRKDGWPAEPERIDALMVLDHFFRRTLAWGVHSGNGRPDHGDEQSDFYTVRIDRRGLRPGVTYVDPYGHLLVVVELVPQDGDAPGILYAIDGQPDGSITRKRFWEGNFLYDPDPALGGAGFRAFRPLVALRQDGARVIEPLGDDAIARHPGYGDLDPAPRQPSAAALHDAVFAVLNPAPVDPAIAQRAAIEALSEQAKTRVVSVENAERWHAKHPGKVIEMPRGYAVFETSGPWEDFSTPSRDLRLLIAIDVVLGFGDKLRRHPEAYGLQPGPALERALVVLERQRAQLLADPALGLSYAGSDGRTHQLTLAELIARAPALELAYDPNDCPEFRWGAPEGSDERRGCSRRAPDEHRRLHEAYRPWFAERRRPPRGDKGPDVEPELGGSP